MMPFKVSLRNIDRSKIKPMSREEQLALIQKCKNSQAELERVCKEQGIPVPVMVCEGVA